MKFQHTVHMNIKYICRKFIHIFGGSLGSVLDLNSGDPGSIPGSVIGDFNLSLISCRLYVVGSTR